MARGGSGRSAPTDGAEGRSPAGRSTIASRTGRPMARASRSRRIAAATTTSGSSSRATGAVRQHHEESRATISFRAGRRTAARSRSCRRAPARRACMPSRCDGDRAPDRGLRRQRRRAVVEPRRQGALQRRSRDRAVADRARAAAGAGRTRRSPTGEDYFPFRARGSRMTSSCIRPTGASSAGRCGAASSRRSRSARRSTVTPPVYTRKRRDFDSTAEQRVLGIMRPVVSPDGKRLAFAALGDIWTATIGATSVSHRRV